MKKIKYKYAYVRGYSHLNSLNESFREGIFVEEWKLLLSKNIRIVPLINIHWSSLQTYANAIYEKYNVSVISWFLNTEQGIDNVYIPFDHLKGNII